MTEPSIFLTVIYFVALLALIALIFWIVWKIGNRNALKAAYEKLYSEIEKDLKEEVTPELYAIIIEKLETLGQLKYKDKLKTIALTNIFWAKFETEASKIMKEFENKIKPEK